MTNRLRAHIDELASTFASAILTAIRGSSLQDIFAQTGGATPARRGPGRPRGSSNKASAPKGAEAKHDVQRGVGTRAFTTWLDRDRRAALSVSA
jgi:hypothetical protein